MTDWLAFLLVALAAWRTWRLIAEDDILERPRRYVTRLGNEWQQDGDPVPDAYRARLAEFLTCPYCLGFWVAAAWTAAYAVWPHGTVWAALPFAVSTVVVMVEDMLTD